MKIKMNERVLLVGGRSKAKAMALSLVKHGYKVTVINSNYEDCMKLAEMKDVTVIHGDGTKPYILDEAGATDCDLAIALTNKDADNLVICQLCKNQFHVKKTVSIVVDPNKTAFFYQMGVDSVVCTVTALTGIIQQQALIDEISNVIPVGEGRVQIAEMRVYSESIIAGKKLWEIKLPQECIIGCVLRGDSFIIPRGDTRIMAGDTLVAIAGDEKDLEEIRNLAGR